MESSGLETEEEALFASFSSLSLCLFRFLEFLFFIFLLSSFETMGVYKAESDEAE